MNLIIRTEKWGSIWILWAASSNTVTNQKNLIFLSLGTSYENQNFGLELKSVLKYKYILYRVT